MRINVGALIEQKNESVENYRSTRVTTKILLTSFLCIIFCSCQSYMLPLARNSIVPAPGSPRRPLEGILHIIVLSCTYKLQS